MAEIGDRVGGFGVEVGGGGLGVEVGIGVGVKPSGDVRSVHGLVRFDDPAGLGVLVDCSRAMIVCNAKSSGVISIVGCVPTAEVGESTDDVHADRIKNTSINPIRNLFFIFSIYNLFLWQRF